ncbi:MAG: hypothetical protein ACYC19_05435 [Acidimicrobiales bacterium]
MNRPGRRLVTWILGVGVLVVVVGVWAFAVRSPVATGDPGAAVMNQLTPTVSALPGYGTSAVPWVSQIPQSLKSSFAIKLEPHQDSCDGRPGTQGWSQVVVESRFRWSRSIGALISFMRTRLTQLGWTAVPQSRPQDPPGQSWTKTLSNGSRADLNVTQEGSPTWQLVATAKPVGKPASGC